MRTSMGFVEGMMLGLAGGFPKQTEHEKQIDWNSAKEICFTHPDSVIEAGLMEDWDCTKGVIFRKGKFINPDDNDDYFYGCSTWATPILLIDDSEEIECYYEPKENADSDIPNWWTKERK